MAYCKNCGKQIEDGVQFCSNCGADQRESAQQNVNYPAVVDNGGFGWGVLGFCIPIVGLILFLVWRDTKPRTGKAAGKGALISVIISVVFYVLTAALGLLGAMY